MGGVTYFFSQAVGIPDLGGKEKTKPGEGLGDEVGDEVPPLREWRWGRSQGQSEGWERAPKKPLGGRQRGCLRVTKQCEKQVRLTGPLGGGFLAKKKQLSPETEAWGAKVGN